jgi:hypothetical protein
VIGATRQRTTSALLVLAVLLGLLGCGAALAHPAPEQSQQGVAASPLHAGQLVVRAHAAELRALAERGRRQGPGSPTSVPVAAVVAALVWAGLTLRGGAWRPGRAAGSRGWPRRTWSRAPPRHLQPA